MRRLISGLVAVGLVVAACTSDPTVSEEYRDVASQLVAVQQQLDEMTVERDALAEEIESAGTEPFDLDAFAAAQGSGDADLIRPFYTDDAVIMPFGHILSTLGDHPMPEYWDVSGPDMDREAAEHHGGTFNVLSTEQNGNMVATTGQWTFPAGMFPDSEKTIIRTASVSHLRDGKIWRAFLDFEVYVDGELIDM